MKEFDIKIDTIIYVRQDTLEKDHPCIFDKPREHNSIGVVISGELSNITKDYSFTARKGDVFIVKSGNIDISRAVTDSVSYVYCEFFSSPISTSPETFDLVNHVREPELITNEFRRAEKIWASGHFLRTIQCREIIYSIINRIVSENYAGTESAYKYERIRPAIEYISQRFPEDIRHDALASLCSMSAGNLSRLFAEVTGKPLSAYITSVRIENAKRLLATRAYQVGEVAEMCGYSDVYSFSRAFKRVCGVSPSKF